MKSLLVADNRPELLATVEPILKHWGYRILSTRNAADVMPYIQESAPRLLLMGEEILADKELALDATVIKQINSGKLPLIALDQKAAIPAQLTPAAKLSLPLDLFELFAFIQAKVEKHPRQNLRLRVLLPGMYSVEKDNFILADVLSLSMQGLFFKAAAKLKKGDQITVVIPLLGHCKEIEVAATVLYLIQPDPENNYMQGFGVGFNEVPEQNRKNLQDFIRERLLLEVSNSQDGVGEFNTTQLKV